MINQLYSSYNTNDIHTSTNAIQRLLAEIIGKSGSASRKEKVADLTADQKRLAASILDDNLNPMAVAYHNIFSTMDEIQEYIYNKYFETPEDEYINQLSTEERYAMYENDINAIFYGLDEDNTNFYDPRIYFTDEDWSRINSASSDIDKMNQRMEDILREYDIKLSEDSYLVINFNPYTFEVSISGNETNQTINSLTRALNQNQNSKDLFLYTLQNSSFLNQDSVNKMYAYQNIFNYTGEALNNLRLYNGNFYNSNNENILDVMKNNMQNLFLNNSFINNQYDNTSNILKNLAQVGWNNVPDLELQMVYSMREGAFVPGVVYNV